jgi:pimeloyl-ACP methyl ester carboxylesterase
MPYARNGDVELYYEIFGDAGDPPLLLVNGLGSQSINYADAWCEQLAAAGFFTIRFDNRDVGLSSKLEGREYTLEDMAADALAVLDALGIERAHVHGISLGGAMGQVLAIEHPERLLTLTAVMCGSGDPSVGGSSPEARELLTAPPPADRESYVAHFLAQQRVWGSPACYDEARLAPLAAAAFDRCFDPAGRERQLRAAFASPDRTEALRAIRVPTLVLHGDEDRLVDVSAGRHLASVIPGARFELMRGMGHDYPPQYWERWVQLVAAHAASLPVEQSTQS